MITVKRYTPENHHTWNEFVKQSRQGTFLFDRNYMDCLLYTSDAADELDGVDLGGRRIIKKKNE